MYIFVCHCCKNTPGSNIVNADCLADKYFLKFVQNNLLKVIRQHLSIDDCFENKISAAVILTIAV